MSGPRRFPLNREGSLSSVEGSLNTLVQPQIAPITIYPGPGVQGKQLSKADIDLVTRLQQLRHDEQNESIPSEDEVCARLARLKGLPPDHFKKKSAYQPPKPQSEMQQVQNLLAQVTDEIAIDSKLLSPEEELEERLARLRGVEPSSIPKHSTEQKVQASSLYTQTDFDELQDIDMEDLAKIMLKESSSADTMAQDALKSLHKDPEVAKLIAEVSKSQKKVKSDPEKFSDSDDDSDIVDAQISLEDYTKNEVKDIISMYSKKKAKGKKNPTKMATSDTEESEKESDSLSD